MRIVTFAGTLGEERLGALVGDTVVDLAAAAQAAGHVTGGAVADALAFLAAGNAGRDTVRHLLGWVEERGEGPFVRRLEAVRLLAPVPRPPKILCLAGNYAEHWREGGLAAPSKEGHAPQVFIKPVTTITGPGAPILLPGPLCTAMDYEGELAAVIGRHAKDVAPDRALDHVAGYANFNDVSGRALTIDVPREQSARTAYFDWLNGKWFDASGPLGPYLSVDEVADPQALALETRVNGRVRQRASTGDMIFTVAETVAWISRFLTLQPGDVIATGTPSGVGATTNTFLQPGDVVEVEITGLGVLRNAVTAEAREQA